MLCALSVVQIVHMPSRRPWIPINKEALGNIAGAFDPRDIIGDAIVK